jgi:hypothetical protein
MIINRETYVHRDVGSAPMDYDLLFSSGTHEQCMLDIWDLGLRLSYLPDTVVGISGKVLRHGVKTWDGGERICRGLYSPPQFPTGNSQICLEWGISEVRANFRNHSEFF